MLDRQRVIGLMSPYERSPLRHPENGQKIGGCRFCRPPGGRWAEAMAEAVASSELATKSDLLAVKSDLEHSIGQLRINLEYQLNGRAACWKASWNFCGAK